MHDRVRGALLGLATGDALGMPVAGLSHQNVRTYYRGIKSFRADEKRGDLGAGAWTALTQRAFAAARALVEDPARPDYARAWLDVHARRRALDRDAEPTVDAAVAATPLGLWWAAVEPHEEAAAAFVVRVLQPAHPHPDALAAAVGHAAGVARLVRADAATLDGSAWLAEVARQTEAAEEPLGATGAVSDRLRRVAGGLDGFPLDLQDLCDGTGYRADEAWPFAAAMLARNPELVEATLLPAVNVGGSFTTSWSRRTAAERPIVPRATTWPSAPMMMRTDWPRPATACTWFSTRIPVVAGSSFTLPSGCTATTTMFSLSERAEKGAAYPAPA